MRYLKRQTINRRIANDPALYIDYKNANVIMGVTDSLKVPTGTTAQQPGNVSNTVTLTPVNGMIRYNSTTNEFEGYQSGTWRSFRFKEANQITQQNLGAGDSSQIYFGPLSPISPTVSASGATWGGQNIIVVVENVLQLNAINYTVIQGTSGAPFTIGDAADVGTLSVAGSTGSKTLYFNTSLIVSTASWSGSVATVTLTNTSSSGQPFAIGATITVTGMSPSGYNGIYTVTGGSATTVTYALVSNPGTFQYAGTVTATGTTSAIFASLSNIVGTTVSGTGIAAASTIVSYTMDPNTDSLTSITMNNFPSATIAVNSVSITLGAGSKVVNDNSYYLKFTEPVPYGKVVTALIGFDQ
jgi:hypothetical protein